MRLADWTPTSSLRLGRVQRLRRVPTQRRFVKDVRGSVLVEYVVLIGVVGLVVTAALIQIGPSILQRYQPTRNTLTAPVP